MFGIVSSLVSLVSEVIIIGYYHESSDCFEYPQKTRLKSGHLQKNMWQIFLTQKVLWVVV